MNNFLNNKQPVIPNSNEPEKAMEQIVNSFLNDHNNEDQLIGEIRMLAKDDNEMFSYLEKVKNHLNPLTWRKLQLSRIN